MEDTLRTMIDDWRTLRQLTLDLLDVIQNESLRSTVGRNMGTLGKQYRHIGDVQLCYTKAIMTGKISFCHYRRDYSLEESKEKLKGFLEEVDADMLGQIEKNPSAKIDWFGEELSMIQHLRALMDHEILHHGELVVYIRTLGIAFPKSWEAYGLA